MTQKQFIMKNYFALFACFFVTTLMIAQSETKTYVAQGDLIEATYYYEDGSIEQRGTFKDGKLHGTWTSYDVDGNKLAVGTYKDGVKTGKWFFWTDDSLREVDYIDSRIVSVHEWKDKNKLAIRNR